MDTAEVRYLVFVQGAVIKEISDPAFYWHPLHVEGVTGTTPWSHEGHEVPASCSKAGSDISIVTAPWFV